RIDLTDFSPAPEAPLPLPGPASSGGKPGAPPGVPPPPDLPAEETNPFAGTPPAPAETAAPGQTGAAKLYAMGETQAGEPTVKAAAIPVPAASALPASLPMSRALRAFNARWPSAQQVELDEEATVEATAEHRRRVIPIVQPVKERWFEVHVVVEQGPSMLVWADTLQEFRLLLARTGVFRDVRLWQFELDPGERPAANRAFV